MYIRTYLYTYIHTCMHAYIHTQVYIYMLTPTWATALQRLIELVRDWCQTGKRNFGLGFDFPLGPNFYGAACAIFLVLVLDPLAQSCYSLLQICLVITDYQPLTKNNHCGKPWKHGFSPDVVCLARLLYKTFVMPTIKLISICPLWQPAITNSLRISWADSPLNWPLWPICLPCVNAILTSCDDGLWAISPFARCFDSARNPFRCNLPKKPRCCGVCVCMKHFNTCRTCTRCIWLRF